MDYYQKEYNRKEEEMVEQNISVKNGKSDDSSKDRIEANSDKDYTYVTDPQILLTMTIQLEGDKTDQIIIYENDNPRIIAYHFGKKHQLSLNEIKLVEDNIKKNVKQVLKENAS